MTLVRNRLPQLSGNRWLLGLFTILVIGACSPKTRWVSNPVNKPVETPPPPMPAPKPVAPPAPKVSVISLILPFGLDHIGLGQHYDDISLKKAKIAADYYRGFKLALDSLAWFGYNYKLELFDSRDNSAQSHSLAYNPKVRASDLIVGPVFPEDVKVFTAVLTSPRKPIVSPLSPESPSTFKNQNLVTVNPPLDYHAWATAKFINDKIKPQKVFILKSGFTEDDAYIIPFKKAIDSLSAKHIKVISITIVRGQLSPLLPQLTKKGQNIFVIPSTNQEFLTVTLHSLDTMNSRYPVTLFGHPSWEHFAFLKPKQLQRLRTHITSADKVDYNSPQTIAFIKSYRNEWHTEPSAYALKGFDEGLYFGRLLAENNIKNMADFTGLHNSFHFEKKPGLGWVNTHVNLLVYTNFELKKAE
jgi:ABC-type branched-subunit amino acid transport system substrate-binding protein